LNAVLRIFSKAQAEGTGAPGCAPYGEGHIEHLVRQAAEGSVEAFGSLYEAYFNRLFRYAYFHLRSKMAAEDAAEEVFIKAWRAIKTCRGREKTFTAWLYRIARNHVTDVQRRQRQQVPLEEVLPAESNNYDDCCEANEEHKKLMDAIALLPEQQRQVVVLKFIEGMDNAEISAVTGKSQGAVRILQMRALTALKAKAGRV
jgi:RNA polymerase sigma-70 factor (ECF subfamily)